MPRVRAPRPRRVTVLDLATYLAAPVCATLLGEFGADGRGQIGREIEDGDAGEGVGSDTAASYRGRATIPAGSGVNRRAR